MISVISAMHLCVCILALGFAVRAAPIVQPSISARGDLLGNFEFHDANDNHSFGVSEYEGNFNGFGGLEYDDGHFDLNGNTGTHLSKRQTIKIGDTLGSLSSATGASIQGTLTLGETLGDTLNSSLALTSGLQLGGGKKGILPGRQ